MAQWLSSVDDVLYKGDNYVEACRRLFESVPKDRSPSELLQYSRIDRSIPALAALDEKLKAASTILRSLKSPTSVKGPIRVLPIDILRRIFIIGSAVPLNWAPTQAALCRFPVLVSHVCLHWRDMALQLESIWAYLYFGSTKSQLRTTNTLLDRTGNSSLHIFLHSPSKAAFSLALRFHARWSSMNVSLDDGDDYRAADDAVEEFLQQIQKLPGTNLLRTLVVRRPGEVHREECDQAPFHKYMDMFYTLDLESSGVSWYPIVLPHLIILRLSGYHFHPNALLQTLQFCPALEELSLSCSSYLSEDPYIRPDDIIVLLHLTILRLSVLDNAGIAVCENVRAPNLNALALDSECCPFLDDIIEFVQYSPFITSFEISGICKHYQHL
jgi:hypothetical protein